MYKYTNKTREEYSAGLADIPEISSTYCTQTKGSVLVFERLEAKLERFLKRSGNRQRNDFVSQTLSKKLALNAKEPTDVRGVDTTCPIPKYPLQPTSLSLISYAKIAVNKLNSVNCLCFGMRALIRPATLCMAISMRWWRRGRREEVGRVLYLGSFIHISCHALLLCLLFEFCTCV